MLCVCENWCACMCFWSSVFLQGLSIWICVLVCKVVINKQYLEELLLCCILFNVLVFVCVGGKHMCTCQYSPNQRICIQNCDKISILNEIHISPLYIQCKITVFCFFLCPWSVSAACNPDGFIVNCKIRQHSDSTRAGYVVSWCSEPSQPQNNVRMP